MKTIKIFSFLKILILSLLHIIISPILFILPKYKTYIFVITTGRSGSNNLSNLFKDSKKINSFHEAYPRINNYFNFRNGILKLWNFISFYFVKVPKILMSFRKGNEIYLETNHLFLKSFGQMAVKFFGGKLKIIVLKREPYKVAKSIFEIGKMPGTKEGNQWYLDPDGIHNRIQFKDIFLNIEDPKKEKFEDFYKSLWYWYEMEIRSREFLNRNSFEVLSIETNELNDVDNLLKKINTGFSLNLSRDQVMTNPIRAGKNLKQDEKTEKISESLAKEKAEQFYKLLSLDVDLKLALH